MGETTKPSDGLQSLDRSQGLRSHVRWQCCDLTDADQAKQLRRPRAASRNDTTIPTTLL